MAVSARISGEVVPISSYTSILEKYSPVDGEKLYDIGVSNAKEIDRAVTEAQAGFETWSKVANETRARLLRLIGQKMRAIENDLAHLETLDTGKPITSSKKVDIQRSIQNFEFFASYLESRSDQLIDSSQSELHQVFREGLGVVAVIAPWNLPLYLLTWKIAPALAAGNAVIAKPSEVTPMTAHVLGGIISDSLKELKLPASVFQIVHGPGLPTGNELTSHPLIKAISFTGSTAVGKQIARIASTSVLPSPIKDGSLKKVSLEMGGKNATLIFADADLDWAAKEAVRASFSNQGQICLCGSRILIEESVFENVKSRIVHEMSKLKKGSPLNSNTTFGSLVSKVHFDKVVNAVDRARKEGAKIIVGGKSFSVEGIPTGQGCYYEPTLIEEMNPNCFVNQEEVFGPVATLISFKDFDDAVRIANGTQYGLSASVFTKNIDKANAAVRALKVGMVWVNSWMKRDLRTPFGGVKESGFGREGADEAYRFFSEAKTVSIHFNPI